VVDARHRLYSTWPTFWDVVGLALVLAVVALALLHQLLAQPAPSFRAAVSEAKGAAHSCNLHCPEPHRHLVCVARGTTAGPRRSLGPLVDRRAVRLAAVSASSIGFWILSTTRQKPDGSLLQQKFAAAAPHLFVTPGEVLGLHPHSKLWLLLHEL
jgi:hypothetical protein